MQRPLACLFPPFDSVFAVPCAREMMRSFWFSGGERWKAIAQRFGNVLMQHLPATLEQALVCGVLHQCVLERVSRFRRFGISEHQFCFLQLDKRGA